MLRSLTASLCFAAGLSALPACRSAELPEVQETVEPFTKLERRRNPNTGTRWKEWEVLVYPDGRKLKHGTEFTWHPNDQLEQERFFDHGEVTGRMRTWYNDGTLRSEYTFGTSERATPMRFWHPDGSPSAAGDAINGRRVGPWRYYHPGGALAESGPYVDGRRQGEWTEFHPDGSPAARGTYVNGKKVGQWERWPCTPQGGE